MRRILICGAGGQLGRACTELLGRTSEVTPLPHEEVDVTDLAQVREVAAAVRPAVIINAAAYTDVDGAEAEPARAYRVNALGARNVALAAEAVGAVLVHISTDYVFDGESPDAYRIDDRPAPLNVYGASKLLGERYVTWVTRRYFLARTSWLYGVGGRNFVETMLRAGPQRGVVDVVTDQVGAPTFARDLAWAIDQLLSTGAYGPYHVTNQGATSWSGFAQEIFRQAGIAADVRPAGSESLGRPARRPKNSRLDPFPLAETIGALLPPWEDGLRRYLNEREAAR